MVTGDERREVAERLRALEVPPRVKRMEHPKRTAAWYELICGTVGGKRDPWFGVKALANRLADLIEPSESGQNRDRNQDSVQKESPIVQIEHECDREALLSVADALDDLAVRESELTPLGYSTLANRIREACGEVGA